MLREVQHPDCRDPKNVTNGDQQGSKASLSMIFHCHDSLGTSFMLIFYLGQLRPYFVWNQVGIHPSWHSAHEFDTTKSHKDKLFD